ncbi:MAG: NAD-dependent epimerase/dehydratase family protein [Chloroflexota bacterium]
MTDKKALVTGGAGFIGSHLVDRLVQDGSRVAVVDNLATGRRENVHPSALFHCVDLRAPDLAEVFGKERPQVVFHLAAQTSVVRSVEEPAEDARNNILGSINLLEQCRRFGVERFIYSSTGGALYGEPEKLPCAETHPVRPLSPYGASKYAVEIYVHYFGRLAGFRYTILRYGNVYGPRQDPHGEAGVIAMFAKRMLEGREVVIFGDGNQERDFVYVSDVVEANVKTLEQEENESYNIGTGTGTSVNTVFERLAQIVNYDKPPRYEPPRPGEVYKIYLDVRKARRSLGWVAEVDLEAGVRLTVKHLRGAC